MAHEFGVVSRRPHGPWAGGGPGAPGRPETALSLTGLMVMLTGLERSFPLGLGSIGGWGHDSCAMTPVSDKAYTTPTASEMSSGRSSIRHGAPWAYELCNSLSRIEIRRIPAAIFSPRTTGLQVDSTGCLLQVGRVQGEMIVSDRTSRGGPSPSIAPRCSSRCAPHPVLPRAHPGAETCGGAPGPRKGNR